MSEVWAVIVCVVIAMIIYGYVSSKLSARKRKKLRAETVPAISESIRKGVAYNIHLSDGRKFENVQVIGSVENEDDAFSFAGFDGMLVLLQENGKKVFLKKPSIRYIVEV